VVALGVTCALPLARPPVEKPVPAQLVALPLVQVSVLVPPSGMAVGDAARFAVTGGPTVTVAPAGVLVAPPAPVQLSE
jgi:hypothetical protein